MEDNKVAALLIENNGVGGVAVTEEVAGDDETVPKIKPMLESNGVEERGGLIEAENEIT